MHCTTITFLQVQALLFVQIYNCILKLFFSYPTHSPKSNWLHTNYTKLIQPDIFYCHNISLLQPCWLSTMHNPAQAFTAPFNKNTAPLFKFFFWNPPTQDHLGPIIQPQNYTRYFKILTHAQINKNMEHFTPTHQKNRPTPFCPTIPLHTLSNVPMLTITLILSVESWYFEVPH